MAYNQLLLVAGTGESGTQKPANYHGSIKSYWGINTFQGWYQRTYERTWAAHSKSKYQWTVIVLNLLTKIYRISSSHRHLSILSAAQSFVPIRIFYGLFKKTICLFHSIIRVLQTDIIIYVTIWWLWIGMMIINQRAFHIHMFCSLGLVCRT